MNSFNTSFFCLLVLLISYNANAQRTALLETFTNASCSVCATYMPKLKGIHDTTIIPFVEINYHTLYPGLDSMYFDNAAEQQQKFDAYGLLGTSKSIINGHIPINTSTLTLAWNSHSSSFETASAAVFDMNIDQALTSDTAVQVQISITPSLSYIASDSFVLQVVLIEKKINESQYVSPPGYNSETEYYNVFRTFISPLVGQPLVSLSPATTASYTLNNTCFTVKSNAQKRVVAYVQNKYTKEVLQAIESPLTFTTPILTIIEDTIYISTNLFDTIYQTLYDTQFVFGSTMPPTTTYSYTTSVTPVYSSITAIDTLFAMGPFELLHNIIVNEITTLQHITTSIITITTFVLIDNIEEQTTLSVVSPNPTHSYFSLRDINDIEHVKIINNAGQMVSKFNAPNERYSVEGLAKGVYFLLIETLTGRAICHKIIIE